MKKQQILYIHGGMTFRNKRDYIKYLKTRDISIEKKIRWNDEYLEKSLGKQFEIIRPRMPLADNAKYKEWKIHFEKYIPHLKSEVILIGLSLGGIFFAKYLSENKFPKKIKSLYLIAPPFDTLSEEDLVGGFKLKGDLSKMEENCKNINLFFSKNDDVVPIENAVKYEKRLKSAKILVFEDKNGHFKVSKFPELIRIIKEDVKKK